MAEDKNKVQVPRVKLGTQGLEALKQLPREKIQLATKCGIAGMTPTGMIVKGNPEYVRSCCEASLKRLGVEYIDLYYQHRIDTTIPIEETASHPRYKGENLEKNKNIYTRIANLSVKHNCTPAQLALAWVLEQGDDVVPIPGTTKIKNLENNIGSLLVKLTKEDLKEISDAVPIDEVAGDRTYESMKNASWIFANTPPNASKV
ncbi:hypothetical protein Pint_20522 [Pistacia integerrima]|uniref:Uncharacterized protein n=1 Tax=Pistacia integerrima TaxID=434235 RepID=A0ACC0XAJ8_9ROSI|nr:hypothetical protein Pint_20522 [Pistacia integerrima]